jgi:F-type H+-transporting ATPase subunit delta
MIELVAKRYVKALMSKDSDNLSAIYDELKTISNVYNSEKFKLILSSTSISTEDKVNLILSFVPNCNQITTNLIKLLGENKRLDIIPHIAKELKYEISVLKNQYDGIVYTNKELSNDEMNKIESQFAKKFNITLTLTQNICNYDGVKVEVNGLGYEVGFAKSRLKAQMIDYILKAI